MGALSLVCGDCGAQLKSAKEAQDHAENFGHVNFEESTEAVKNLVCKECGKPCKSATEQDIHTKRTGHAEFEDRTHENVKEVDMTLEDPSAAAGPSADVGGSGSGDTEMTEAEGEEVVEDIPVSEEMVKQIEEMGFPKVRAQRALLFSGRTDLEGAVNWIVEHSEDANLDEPIKKKELPKKEPEKKQLTKEEKLAKVEELRLAAKKRKEAEERRLEKEREKQRVESGKNLLKIKQEAAEAERKRIAEQRKKEKLEEQKERARLKAELEKDKLERLAAKGKLPPKEKQSKEETVKEEEAKKKPSNFVEPTLQDNLREPLRKLKRAHDNEDGGEKVKKAFNTLSAYITNILKAPHEEKFRKIRIGNNAFQTRVATLEGGLEFLRVAGFEEDGEFLVNRDTEPARLNLAASELQEALTNPFFGKF